MRPLVATLLGLLILSSGIGGCSSEQSSTQSDSAAGEEPEVTTPGSDDEVDTNGSSQDYVSETLACRYDNSFSGSSECKEYRGMWLRADIEDDCREVLRLSLIHI